MKPYSVGDTVESLDRLKLCPVCGEERVVVCTCEEQHSKCKNGHVWHWDELDTIELWEYPVLVSLQCNCNDCMFLSLESDGIEVEEIYPYCSAVNPIRYVGGEWGIPKWCPRLKVEKGN